MDDCGKKKCTGIEGLRFKKKERTLTHRTGESPEDTKNRSRKNTVERERSAARPSDMPLLPRVRRAPRGQRICIRKAGGDLISSGNFQAKLKLDSFAEFETHQKIGAALGDVHGLRRN